MITSTMRLLPLFATVAAMLALAACGNESTPEPAPESDPEGAADVADGAAEPAENVAAYEEAIDAQREVVGELTAVLEGVTDEASAEAAAPRIEELSRELQSLAMRINAIPQLPYAEQQRISEERAGSTAARRERGKQMLKIEQYPVLKEAWARGMRGVEE
ncbi:MAG TPA: hypothetical protein VJ883_12680 [Woeseiaceae bacterium]|nr:hypothetical protein [Woeseiaceae bacterium]